MKMMIRSALAATFIGAATLAGEAADLPAIKAPPPPVLADNSFQPFQVRLEVSGVVPTSGNGTVYDEGAFYPPTGLGKLFAPYGGDYLIPLGLSAGPGTVVPGGSTNTSYAVIPTLSVDYYLNRNWSIEAICCIVPAHIQGTGTIQSTFAHTFVFPPSLLVDYHFTNWGAFQPYLGVGVNFTTYWGTRVNNEQWPVLFNPAGALSPTLAGLGVYGAFAQHYSATVTPSWGVVGQAGFDYMFNEHWGVNVDVKYIMMEPIVHAKVALFVPGAAAGLGPLYLPVRVYLPIDPIVASVGLTYRFGGGTAAPILAKY
jgi:outer membrane protein